MLMMLAEGRGEASGGGGGGRPSSWVSGREGVCVRSPKRRLQPIFLLDEPLGTGIELLIRERGSYCVFPIIFVSQKQG